MSKNLDRINETSDIVKRNQINCLDSEFSENPELLQLLKYTIEDYGILFRPYLFRLGLELDDLNYLDFLPILTSIEFIQKSTIAIDDILDNSPLRNNKPTLYKKYGIKNSIVIGEILKNLGVNMVFHTTKYPVGTKYMILQELENAYSKIYKGQYLDLEYEAKDNISEQQYYEMIYLTTGSFIEASLVCGILSTKKSQKHKEVFRKFGQKLGIAYQIRDDIVNLISDGSNGKILAEDLRGRKKRLPVIHFLNNASEKDYLAFVKIWKQKNYTNQDIINLLELLKKEKSIDYTFVQLRNLLNDAYELIYSLRNDYSINPFEDVIDIIGQL